MLETLLESHCLALTALFHDETECHRLYVYRILLHVLQCTLNAFLCNAGVSLGPQHMLMAALYLVFI